MVQLYVALKFSKQHSQAHATVVAVLSAPLRGMVSQRGI